MPSVIGIKMMRNIGGDFVCNEDQNCEDIDLVVMSVTRIQMDEIVRMLIERELDMALILTRMILNMSIILIENIDHQLDNPNQAKVEGDNVDKDEVVST